MKRIIAHQSKVVSILAALLFTVGFGVLFASSVAWADANFHGTVTISLNPVNTNSGDICDLTASGIDESGLGFTDVTYVLSADAKLGKACQNNGGNFPVDPKKQGSAGKAEGDTTVGVKNGRVRGASVMIDIDDPTTGIPVALSCPSGQRAVVVCCSYKNISLVDMTSSDVATVSTTTASFTLAGAPAVATALCQ